MNAEQKQYLQALADRHGRLTPDEVVADARQPDSPLHPLFEWNVRKAAHAHWIERARELIRYVKVQIITSKRETTRIVPAFVRDPSMPADKQGYRHIAKVRDDKEVAREVVLNECRAVLAALERAKLVADALDMSPAVDDLIERTGTFRREVERRFPSAGMTAPAGMNG